jgi:O-antigen/teichoic acid export membrane protein
MGLKITKKDILWNYLGSIFRFGFSIIILPAVLIYLNPDQLGIWYVFGSISALIMVMDVGFSPTIIKNINYAWSGANQLITEGLPPASTSMKPNYRLTNCVFFASRKIYKIITIISAIVLSTVATIYIIYLDSSIEVLISWSIYAFACIINIYFAYWTPLLKGVGKIKESNQIMIFSRMIYVIIAWVGLVFGGGLILISIAYLLSGIVLRIFAKHIFTKMMDSEIESNSINNIQINNLIKIIWPNARKILLVNLGLWLTSKSLILLVSAFVDLETAARFGISSQLLTFVATFSTLLYSSYLPELSSLRVNGKEVRFRILLARSLTVQWIIGFLGIIGIIFIVPLLFSFIGASVQLLRLDMLILLAIIVFFEWNYATFISIISLSNTVPYMKSALISGFLIIIISFIIFKFSDYGLMAALAMKAIIEFSYNNWKWPIHVLRKDNLSIVKIFKLNTEDIKNYIRHQRKLM